MENKIEILNQAAQAILLGKKDEAYSIIKSDYPFEAPEIFKRNYTTKQKMMQFKRDGFIDRYTGEKLINPGMLRIFSCYYPDLFPYHKNGKMTEGHIAYWELFPTIDHIYPISMGGENCVENWVTTSMLNNHIKYNWTLDQLQWKLHPAGIYDEWDGLTTILITLVERDQELLKIQYIKDWYKASIFLL